MNDKIIFDGRSFEKIQKRIIDGKIGEGTHFSFLNSHCIYEFKNNMDFRRALSNLNKEECIISIDGAPVAIVLSLMNFKRVKRLQGPTFMVKFLESERLNKNKRHYFIGYTEEELDQFCKRYKHIKRNNVFGHKHSFIKGNFFSKKEVGKIAKEINKNKVDYVWNGTGCPRQEILSGQLASRVNVKFFFNVGAALEFSIGRRKRAPVFFQKFGLEWLHRLYTDPKLTSTRLYPSFMGGLYSFVFARLRKK